MKLSPTVLLFGACLSACAHAAQPPTARTAPVPVAVAPIAQLDTAPVRESTPTASGIPADSPRLSPPPPQAASPDDKPLTPASAAGAPRPVSAALVQTDPARDKADTTTDQDSIREIRALIAQDKALGVASSQVTIVARNGRVWLRGQVNTAEQRAAIEKAARRAGGVLDVKNELVVME